MCIKTAVRIARSVAGALAIAGALFSGSVEAGAYDVQVAIRVNAQGLDLQQPSAARTLYDRLEHAAEVACTHGNRVDLKPIHNPNACREQALGEAVHSVNAPLLTQVYLQSHTLQQAAAHKIKVPIQLAAKF
jgi:UrcA family protein